MTPHTVDRQVVTWAAGITAALAIGYVVLGDYLPTFRWTKKMDKDAVPGLYNNYGNDCFANCVIQSLAGLPSFRAYLRNRLRNDGEGELKLTKALWELLIVLNIPGAKSRSVEPVIAALEQMYDLRMSRNQQDSQEFLHLITEALSLEDTNLKKKYKAHQTDHQNGNTETEGLYIPPNPFEGELSTQIQCQRCTFQTPWKKEAFTELSIAVPAKWNCSLEECLANLITVEAIADYACPLCTVQNTLLSLELIPTKPAPLLRATSRLRAIVTEVKSATSPVPLDIDKVQIPAEMEWKPMKGPAMKRTVISKAPQILAVHLVRSVYDRGLGAGRNGCEVSFTEDLEIPVGGEEMERKWKEEAVEDDEEGEKFRLMSVVTHKGWHESGHYMCYRRRKREKKVKKERKDGDVKENVESTVQEIAEGETAPQDEGLMVKLVDSRTKWWEISDEVVLGVDSEHVLRQRKGVYILFYENEKGL